MFVALYRAHVDVVSVGAKVGINVGLPRGVLQSVEPTGEVVPGGQAIHAELPEVPV